jgi:ABC-type dipeptide/oligopeptide/nickel transport system permease component
LWATALKPGSTKALDSHTVQFTLTAPLSYRTYLDNIKDHILMAYANGLPSNLIVYTYMLKNAFPSVLTIIGLLYGLFLGGSSW